MKLGSSDHVASFASVLSSSLVEGVDFTNYGRTVCTYVWFVHVENVIFFVQLRYYFSKFC